MMGKVDIIIASHLAVCLSLCSSPVVVEARPACCCFFQKIWNVFGWRTGRTGKGAPEVNTVSSKSAGPQMGAKVLGTGSISHNRGDE